MLCQCCRLVTPCAFVLGRPKRCVCFCCNNNVACASILFCANSHSFCTQHFHTNRTAASAGRLDSACAMGLECGAGQSGAVQNRGSFVVCRLSLVVCVHSVCACVVASFACLWILGFGYALVFCPRCYVVAVCTLIVSFDCALFCVVSLSLSHKRLSITLVLGWLLLSSLCFFSIRHHRLRGYCHNSCSAVCVLPCII